MSDEVVKDKSSIHAKRQEIGLKRQERHADVLRRLHSKLLTADHPYDLQMEDFESLEEVSEFKRGSLGHSVTAIDADYFYRTCGVMSVVNWVENWNLMEVSDRIFEDLLTQSRKGEWFPLKFRASGTLGGFRSLTWWTTLDILKEGLIRASLQLGLLRVPELAVILRCPASYVQSVKVAKVPTVVDAFTSIVFHPTKDSDQPQCGRTISLESINNLKCGTQEYVFAPIDIEMVEIRAIKIDEKIVKLREAISDSVLWEKLDKYYSQLLEEA